MKPVAGFVLCIGLATATDSASAQHNGHSQQQTQPYAGQETRTVTSLSQDEVDGFLAGKGMGLARPAELNGFPGPAHTLELADKLNLTPRQLMLIESARDKMTKRAQEAGARYIAAEKAVDELMRTAAPDVAEVAKRIAVADAVRAEARMVHISAHLEITPILSEEQRAKYAALRGYANR